MCSFMDVPVNYFITLRGNLPAKNEERIPFLECMATNVDVEFFKEAKTQIFNTNDKELVSKFCELDLVVWQLVMLSSRFEEEHFAVKRIADMARRRKPYLRAHCSRNVRVSLRTSHQTYRIT